MNADANEIAGHRRLPEVMGRFKDRESFTRAVEDLKAAGFEETELSVLDTHEALSAAGKPGDAWQQTLSSLAGEINYIGPISAAGLIALASGPVGAAISAAIAAGFTGAALSEFLRDIRATPHTESFARALHAGTVLLWAQADDPARQQEAIAVMERHGAEDVHVHDPATRTELRRP